MQKKSASWQKLKSIDFYFITDSGISKKGIVSDAREAVAAGCKIIQYREKNKSQLQEALRINKICEKKGALFLINDDVGLAISAGADGVHLGQEDMDYFKARKMLGSKIIGLTVHNTKEAIKAERIGADYIGLSPIFRTSTKKDAGRPCGTEMVKQVRKKTNIPIVAVGGITKQNAADVIKSGADSVAAISAALSGNVGKEVADFIRIIRNSRKSSQLLNPVLRHSRQPYTNTEL